MPHYTLIKIADFQIKTGAWNISMLNWFATILLWGLVYSWMINSICFLAQQSLIKKTNIFIFLYQWHNAVLQIGRSLVRIQLVSLEFFNLSHVFCC